MSVLLDFLPKKRGYCAGFAVSPISRLIAFSMLDLYFVISLGHRAPFAFYSFIYWDSLWNIDFSLRFTLMNVCALCSRLTLDLFFVVNGFDCRLDEGNKPHKNK